MKLYLVRHGESEANRDFLHAGWAPVHLTEKGIEDAKRAGNLIEGIKFDKVFSSDLVRVRETCFHASGISDPCLRPELRELNVGSLAGKSPKALFAEFGEAYGKLNRIRDYRKYGGESMDDLLCRVTGFMKELEAGPYPEMENILAFSSEGPIDMALSYALGINDSGLFRKLSCDNGSLSILELNKGRGWGLRVWNYT